MEYHFQHVFSFLVVFFQLNFWIFSSFHIVLCDCLLFHLFNSLFLKTSNTSNNFIKVLVWAYWPLPLDEFPLLIIKFKHGHKLPGSKFDLIFLFFHAVLSSEFPELYKNYLRRLF